MENVPSARSCARCASLMEAEDRFCQQCGAPAVSTIERPCARCGCALGPVALFCARCGERVITPGMGSPRSDWVERVRSRLTASWAPDKWAGYLPKARGADVARVALPVAVLLLTLALGYGLGRGSVDAADRRAGEHGDGERARSSMPPTSATDLEAVEPGSAPIRFRDFNITASSWEDAHPPIHAADGDPYTFWHAWETERFATGDWLTLTFPEERTISRIGILPGRVGPLARTEGRVRSVLVKAAGAAPQKLTFDDLPQMQLRSLDRPIRARTLILRIVTVVPGSRSRHILVPEVQVWGHSSSPRVSQAP